MDVYKKLTKKQITRGILDRVATQDKIRQQFGQGVIADAVTRLCSNCLRNHGCELIPIMTEGKDCPYYAERGKK